MRIRRLSALMLAGLAPVVLAAAVARAASESVVYSFNGGTDGGVPLASLINVGGTLYGTTMQGGGTGCGGFGCGTVFSVTPTGVEAVLHSFKGGTDGALPFASLINVAGTLYGTTVQGGGTGCGGYGCGTVFSVAPTGVETVLHSFEGGTDGAIPAASLIKVGGALYGTTQMGGSGDCSNSVGCGTVFKVTKAGVEAVVYSFKGGIDGASPYASLINVSGTLYGTTYGGGAGGDCSNSVEIIGCGTVFKVTKAGVEAVVYSFKGGIDGANPYASLINVGGTFYGTTTYGGGASNLGALFNVTEAGAETVVYSFKGGTDGATPTEPLLNVRGAFYGATEAGGGGDCSYSSGCGTVFKLVP
jgi:uncharacterized repeat protein (TIGR03803 family)